MAELPTQKVVGATAGSVIGGAVATIIISEMARHGVTMAEAEQGAIQSLFTSLTTLLFGYITPRGD